MSLHVTKGDKGERAGLISRQVGFVSVLFWSLGYMSSCRFFGSGPYLKKSLFYLVLRQQLMLFSILRKSRFGC